MHRCDRPAGRFEVKFKYLTKPYGGDRADDYLADIGDHQPVYGVVDGHEVMVEDIPRASESTPYVGELCEHELEWLSYLPGFVYARHRRYSVRKLDDSEAAVTTTRKSAKEG